MIKDYHKKPAKPKYIKYNYGSMVNYTATIDGREIIIWYNKQTYKYGYEIKGRSIISSKGNFDTIEDAKREINNTLKGLK